MIARSIAKMVVTVAAVLGLPGYAACAFYIRGYDWLFEKLQRMYGD